MGRLSHRGFEEQYSNHVNVKLDMDELDLTSAEAKELSRNNLIISFAKGTIYRSSFGKECTGYF